MHTLMTVDLSGISSPVIGINERGPSAVFCDENSTYEQILMKHNWKLNETYLEVEV